MRREREGQPRPVAASDAGQEPPLRVFISSAMDGTVDWARQAVRTWLSSHYLAEAWAFEEAPTRSIGPVELYLDAVRSSDFLIWLAGPTTPVAVRTEVEEAINAGVRVLVFLLPGARDGPETRSLTATLKQRATWSTATDAKTLVSGLTASLSDELRHAIRQPHALSRFGDIEMSLNASRVRCLTRWLASGLALEDCLPLVDDHSVGRPPTDLMPSEHQPILLLEGEPGSGKSLMAERVFQSWLLDRATTSTVRQVLFLGAGDPEAAAVLKSEDFGSVRIVLDGLDEAPLARAKELVARLVALGRIEKDFQAFITSRPMPDLPDDVQLRRVPLTQDDKLISAWISLTARRTIEPSEFSFLRRGVQDALRLPLFAFLAGCLIREGLPLSDIAEIDLAGQYFDRTLRKAENSSLASALLVDLGAACTNGAGRAELPRVSVPGVVPFLVESGIVKMEGRYMSFTLPIFERHFAVLSLCLGTFDLSAHLDDGRTLDRWLGVLRDFLAVATEQDVARVLEPIIAGRPGLASLLFRNLRNAYATNAGSVDKTVPRRYVETLHLAMEQWCEGLGPLAAKVGPVTDEGTVETVGWRGDATTLAVGWRKGRDNPKVAVLPAGAGALVYPAESEWELVAAGLTPGLGAKPWADAHWLLTTGISAWLRKRGPLASTDWIESERAWLDARAVMGRLHRKRAISLRALMGRIHELRREIAELSQEVAAVGGVLPDGMTFGDEDRTVDFGWLHEWSLLQISRGKTDVVSTGPVWDRTVRATRVWDLYSTEEKTRFYTQTYDHALEAFDGIAAQWFPGTRVDMPIAGQLPVRLVAIIDEETLERPDTAPTIHMYFEPQEKGPSVASVTVGPRPDVNDVFERLLELRSLFRPCSLANASVISSVMRSFHADAVTRTVLDWVASDLYGIALTSSPIRW